MGLQSYENICQQVVNFLIQSFIINKMYSPFNNLGIYIVTKFTV